MSGAAAGVGSTLRPCVFAARHAIAGPFSAVSRARIAIGIRRLISHAGDAMFPRLFLGLALIACCAFSTASTAQNHISRTILDLTEDHRNRTFTRFLHGNGEPCDQVIHTLFLGIVGGDDQWEMLCRDGNAYSMGVPPDPKQSARFISCKDASALDNLLRSRAGDKSGPKAVCRIR